MATNTWEFGAAGSGLHFKIVYDTVAGTFTVQSLEGSFDLNALWWNDGIADGSSVGLSKADNSLNMNGTREDWDGVAKLSNAGLGPSGENKDSFISVGETSVFTLADFGITGAFDPASGGTLGVRATSVNGGGSIKLVDTTPVPDDGNEPDPSNFPEVANISFVDFYFDKDGDVSTAEAIVRVNNSGSIALDVDSWDDALFAFLQSGNVDADAANNDLAGYTPLGASNHVGGPGGGTLVYYAYDGNDDVDTAPAPGLVGTGDPAGPPFGFGAVGLADFPHAVLSSADGVTFVVNTAWTGGF